MCRRPAREPDAFREIRSEYRITEPLVRFYHAIMRPNYGTRRTHWP
jgi:hypothetical protein